MNTFRANVVEIYIAATFSRTRGWDTSFGRRHISCIFSHVWSIVMFLIDWPSQRNTARDKLAMARSGFSQKPTLERFKFLSKWTRPSPELFNFSLHLFRSDWPNDSKYRFFCWRHSQLIRRRDTSLLAVL
jgi:hypothetical protein